MNDALKCEFSAPREPLISKRVKPTRCTQNISETEKCPLLTPSKDSLLWWQSLKLFFLHLTIRHQVSASDEINTIVPPSVN